MRLQTLSAGVVAGVIILATLMTDARANPINYEIVLTVDQVVQFHHLNDLLNPPAVGSQYRGTLQVDESVLSEDGKSMPGLILGFNAVMGATSWNPDLPNSNSLVGGNDFAGFRGPCYSQERQCSDSQSAQWGLWSLYLGFDVQNGAVTNLWGGVYGSGDQTFIDFNGDRFMAMAMYDAKPEYLLSHIFQQQTFGTLTINRIPEPSTALLFALGLFGVFSFGRKRNGPSMSNSLRVAIPVRLDRSQ
jgi:hypothetical protein